MFFQLVTVFIGLAVVSGADVNTASCKYELAANSQYTCGLTSSITSYTSSLLVTGSHLSGKYDQDVKSVDGVFGTKMGRVHPTIFAKFYNVEEVYLDNSWLVEILPGIIRGNKLRQLYLYSNDITEIQASTFRDAPNLEGLHLDINNIKEIDKDAFLGLSKVKRLNLGVNWLTEIYAKTFDPLTAVEYISLRNNRLENIYSNTFRNLLNLRFLELHNNKLTYIFLFALESFFLKHSVQKTF